MGANNAETNVYSVAQWGTMYSLGVACAMPHQYLTAHTDLSNCQAEMSTREPASKAAITRAVCSFPSRSIDSYPLKHTQTPSGEFSGCEALRSLAISTTQRLVKRAV